MCCTRDLLDRAGSPVCPDRVSLGTTAANNGGNGAGDPVRKALPLDRSLSLGVLHFETRLLDLNDLHARTFWCNPTDSTKVTLGRFAASSAATRSVGLIWSCIEQGHTSIFGNAECQRIARPRMPELRAQRTIDLLINPKTAELHQVVVGFNTYARRQIVYS
jgi:hypothetical protein